MLERNLNTNTEVASRFQPLLACSKQKLDVYSRRLVQYMFKCLSSSGHFFSIHYGTVVSFSGAPAHFVLC